MPYLSYTQIYQFEKISTKNGLTDNHITCLMQDSKGFIWLGTWSGLFKYDGYKYVAYKNSHGDSTSISHNFITSIIEDGSGNIWVGTVDGLNRLDPQTELFQQFIHNPDDPESLFDKLVGAILEDSHGDIWVGTDKGIQKLNKTSNTFSHFQIPISQEDYPNTTLHVRHMHQFKNDLILSPGKVNYWKFNLKDKTFKYIPTNREEEYTKSGMMQNSKGDF